MGAYGCSACHAVYDRGIPLPKGLSREEVEIYFWEGHARSLRILLARNLVRVA